MADHIKLALSEDKALKKADISQFETDVQAFTSNNELQMLSYMLSAIYQMRKQETAKACLAIEGFIQLFKANKAAFLNIDIERNLQIQFLQQIHTYYNMLTEGNSRLEKDILECEFSLIKFAIVNHTDELNASYIDLYKRFLHYGGKFPAQSNTEEIKDRFLSIFDRLPPTIVAVLQIKIKIYQTTAEHFIHLAHLNKALPEYRQALKASLHAYSYDPKSFDELLERSFEAFSECQTEVSDFRTTYYELKELFNLSTYISEENGHGQLLKAKFYHLWAKSCLSQNRKIKGERIVKKALKSYAAMEDKSTPFLIDQRLKSLYLLAELNTEQEAFSTAINYANDGLKLLKKLKKSEELYLSHKINFNHLIAVALGNEEHYIDAYHHFADLFTYTQNVKGEKHHFLYENILFDFLQLLFNMEQFNELYQQKEKLSQQISPSLEEGNLLASLLAIKCELLMMEVEVEQELYLQARSRIQKIYKYNNHFPKENPEYKEVEHYIKDICQYMEKEVRSKLKWKRNLSNKENINRCYDYDPNFRRPGANYHHYSLFDPLSLAEINHFEEQHQIQLPSSLKSFYNLIGNGGCGPERGLYSIPINKENAPLLTIEVVKVQPQHICVQKDFNKKGVGFYSKTTTNSLIVSEQLEDGLIILLLEGPLKGHIAGYNQTENSLNLSKYSDFQHWYEDWLNTSLKKKRSLSKEK